MTHRMLRPALFASLCCLAAGCGALEGQDDAGRGMEALMRALGGGTPGALARAAEDGRPTSLRAFGVDGSVRASIDTTVDCPDGGKMKIEGHAEIDGSFDATDAIYPPGSLDLAFDVAVDFRRCKVDGVKIGGDLRYALDIEADSSGTASLTWSYEGDVTFRGEIKGRCEIDMSASIRSDAGARDVELRAFAGTMCGFDAAEVSAYADLSFGG